MNFDFSDDQKGIRDSVRDVLGKECPADRVRRALAPDSQLDHALWQTIAEQGWLGAAVPENYGGLGLGYLELCLIAGEIGRSCAPVPFSSSVYFAAEALLLAGSEEQKQRWLPRLVAGDAIGVLAATEGPANFAPSSPSTTFADGKLNGLKTPVIDAPYANFAIVWATTPAGPALVLADLDATGVTVSRLKSLDESRPSARLEFEQTPAEPLMADGDASSILPQLLDRAAILVAFEQLGGADKSLELARDYALQRVAFGRPIGSYQAIKHKLADIYVKNELARGHCYYGAWALHTGAPELPRAACAARIAASDAAWFATKECIEAHGGVGFTWEMDPHLYYRRSKQLRLVAGAPQVWRERLAGELLRQGAA